MDMVQIFEEVKDNFLLMKYAHSGLILESDRRWRLESFVFQKLDWLLSNSWLLSVLPDSKISADIYDVPL